MTTTTTRTTAAATDLPRLTLCELTPTPEPGLESYSPFCLKVHRALKAAGLPYERRHSANPAAFKHLNPTGQVPVLLVGEEPVSDSTAILARITQLAPGALDAAREPAQRAEALLWEEFADTALNGFLVAARWADERNWPAVRAAYFGAMPAVLRALLVPHLRRQVRRGLVARDVTRRGPDALWQRFGAVLDQLDARAPAAGFWLGDVLSVADIALFAQLHGLRSALTPWQRDEVARRARLTAYLDRVDARTAARPAPRAAAAEVSGPRAAHAA